ncbi:hypothetical protein [uncultured Arthrobacter sp.]|uniref:hypothetical protein n=1 Tax=uncultured Arthrobacter sp. TaxID=114050 RepID=UPI003217E9E8
MCTIPSSWKPQLQRHSGGSSAAASAGANEYTDMVAEAGAFHSIGIPQWLGASRVCAAGNAAGAFSATALPE